MYNRIAYTITTEKVLHYYDPKHGHCLRCPCFGYIKSFEQKWEQFVKQSSSGNDNDHLEMVQTAYKYDIFINYVLVDHIDSNLECDLETKKIANTITM